MDIRFDASAAEQLLQQMDQYCTGIKQEAISLLEILKDSEQWNDNQKKVFQTNITDMANELNQALSFEGEYMRTYYQRVQELRGE